MEHDDFLSGRMAERDEILEWLKVYAEERGKVDARDEETIRRIARLISGGVHSELAEITDADVAWAKRRVGGQREGSGE